MKNLNIKKSVLSISSPGTHLTPGNDSEARRLTRQVNEDMSRVCSENPDHFLFFASLPLPDVEGSLEEIDYALDQLSAVGFQILSNSHGIYPGDPRFAKVFDKLSERETICFFHPTACNLRNEQTGLVQTVRPTPGIPTPVMEFMFDSTRSLTSLLASGTITRCTGITFLFCHCGATFPPILARIAEFSKYLFPPGESVTVREVKDILQNRFYFDLAGVPFPDQIHGLLRVVYPSRLLYGSDYPYTPEPLAASLAERMDSGLQQTLGVEITNQILLKNAEKLISQTPKN